MLLYFKVFIISLTLVNGLHIHPLRHLSASSILSVSEIIKNTYTNSLLTHPLLTNCGTAGFLAVCSDFVSQNIEIASEKKIAQNTSNDQKISNSRTSLSFYRSSCMFVYGFVVLGWWVTQWFNILNGIIPKDGITWLGAIMKIFINQLFMSPFLNTLFFGYVIFTRGNFSNLIKEFTRFF